MRRRFFCWLLLASLTLSLFTGCEAQEQGSTLTADILKIGKADCTLFQEGETSYMIDTGEAENAPRILEALKEKNVDHLDALIISHFDKDHVGGAAQILEAVTVDRVLSRTTPRKTRRRRPMCPTVRLWNNAAWR